MKEDIIFPKDFLWGASTSAFQVEGGYLKGGMGKNTTGERKVPEGITNTKVASDHYHRYKEDIALMAELGITSYRFSFNWSRIMPDLSGKPNREGLEFYKNLIDELRKYHIEPIVTLYHFEMPQILVSEFGGWKSRLCIEHYLNYAKTCFEYFKGRVNYWITINEQLIAMAAPDLNGNHCNDIEERTRNMHQMCYHMSLAEKKAMRLCKEIDKNMKIGPASAMQVVYPQSSDPEDILAAMNAEELLTYYMLELSIKGRYPNYVKQYLIEHNYFPETHPGDEDILNLSTPDFIGINYYSSICVKAKREENKAKFLPPFFRSDVFEVTENKHLKKIDWMAFGIDPDGLRIGLRRVFERYGLPLIITENGLAYSDVLTNNNEIYDTYRIEYLEKHIEQCHLAMKEGVSLFGYCPWSFLDLLSSHQGFKKRYGLVYVNRTDDDQKDLKRYKKDSFYWYQQVIKNNGLMLDTNDDYD